MKRETYQRLSALLKGKLSGDERKQVAIEVQTEGTDLNLAFRTLNMLACGTAEVVTKATGETAKAVSKATTMTWTFALCCCTGVFDGGTKSAAAVVVMTSMLGMSTEVAIKTIAEADTPSEPVVVIDETLTTETEPVANQEEAPPPNRIYRIPSLPAPNGVVDIDSRHWVSEGGTLLFDHGHVDWSTGNFALTGGDLSSFQLLDHGPIGESELAIQFDDELSSNFGSVGANFAAVPEPSTGILAALAIMGLGLCRRRRR